MKAYFAYVRVSTARQGEQGSSLQEQRTAIEAYAARQGLSIVEWFEEIETAAKTGRPRFREMTGKLRRGKAVGAIIHKIDRSARNLKDWAQLGELIDRGIEIHFAHETLDLGSRGGRLAADIQAVVAADFIRNLRQETRKGMYGRLKQGLYPWRAPIGYVDCGGGKPKELHPVLGPLVREAFELYASGRYTLDEIRRVMHGRGLCGHSGRGLSRSSMALVLHNPFYTGIIRLQKTGEAFEGVHKPLVKKAVFEQVQAVLTGRFYARKTKHRFVYRRLLRCVGCGYSLIGELQKGHVYYRCHTVACRGVSVSEEDVDAKLRSLFAPLAFSPEELGDLRGFGDAAGADRAALAAAQRKQAKLALGHCEDRLNRLTDAYLDQALDKEAFEARKGALLMERRGHQEALETPEDGFFTDTVLENLELGNTAQQSLETAFPEEKREMVIRATSNLSVAGKNLDFRLRFPFDTVADWRLHRECAPRQPKPRKSPGDPCGVGTNCTRHPGPCIRDLYDALTSPAP